MDINNTVNNLKLNGFVNAGPLVFSQDEINELTHLCRKVFNNLNESSKDGELHKDLIDSSAGAEGFTRVPEHSPRVAELLNKLLNDINVIKILNEVMGPDYKIWQIIYRKSSVGDKGLSLHQDAEGEANLSILLADNKKGFGATIFLPFSHLFNKTIKQLKINIPVVILPWILFLFSPLTGDQGDISLFFNHTWHGRAPNKSQTNYDVILFSFFPASTSLPSDGYDGYGDWSDEFLIDKTTITRLVNPRIGTKALKNGRYKILSSKDLKTNKPFVLKLNKNDINLINIKNFNLYFKIFLLRLISIIVRPFKILIKYLISNKT